MKTLRTAVALLLGLALAGGPVAEVHGFHQCPHHGSHGPPAGSDAASRSAPFHHAGSGHHRVASDPLEAPPEGPCTCIGSCHGVPTAPGLASVPALPVALAVDGRLTPGTPDGRVPRSGAYLLPFPNGPPILPA